MAFESGALGILQTVCDITPTNSSWTRTRAIEGTYEWGQPVFGHDMDDPDLMDESDSASFVPRCVIADASFDWAGDTAPRTPLAETIIYETHVKGFTQLNRLVPEDVRGTYAGLADPAAIKHFVDLGITAVELMPVQQFVQDMPIRAPRQRIRQVDRGAR
jgi:isoamylase